MVLTFPLRPQQLFLKRRQHKKKKKEKKRFCRDYESFLLGTILSFSSSTFLSFLHYAFFLSHDGSAQLRAIPIVCASFFLASDRLFMLLVPLRLLLRADVTIISVRVGAFPVLGAGTFFFAAKYGRPKTHQAKNFVKIYFLKPPRPPGRQQGCVCNQKGVPHFVIRSPIFFGRKFSLLLVRPT